MGKAVPKAIKQKAYVLLKEYPENFSEDFEKNKEAMSKLELPLTKVSRNLVAGFISRKKSQEAKTKGS